VSDGGGFFRIDRRIWKILCGRNDADAVHAAVCYLTIAAGTGRSNLVSRWSANAVESYTGLHSSRAKSAINVLLSEGYLSRSPKYLRTRPVYELEPFANVLQGARAQIINENGIRKPVLQLVLRGKAVVSSDKILASQMVLGGILWKSGALFVAEPPSEEETNSLWLPNSLVTGTREGEASPIKRLRSRGDLWSLRLLVDLYHAQNLSADGGISRSVLRRTHVRRRYGERGRKVIWGFSDELEPIADRASSTEAFWEEHEVNKAPDKKHKIWPCIQALQEMGLIVEVPHLVENSSLTCEPIHGLSFDRKGEPMEQQLYEAALRASHYLMSEASFWNAIAQNIWALIPVWDTLPDIQVVGVFRLTYRPQTFLTADWYRRQTETAEEFLEEYKEIGPPTAEVIRPVQEDW
jgi:hypothetical protein